ncbi:hypothetical protein CWRG_00328 [Chthonomonas calidirosea]|uniref:hypothetical protein n=1 Tax=Chthonomonas calidirosea TaxID=454171 RepID=UPI0006DD49EF|nr:hypothetical protein [Chthonomonas calidirosea]CEK13036.1 hypothetical protein CWRG_00328 [Chthonomonas calidirosea]
MTPRRIADLRPLCVAVFGLLWLGLCAPLSAAPTIALQPLLGFGSFTGGITYYRPHSWNPLAVHLVGTAPKGATQLQVIVRRGDHQDTYIRNLLFAGGPLDQTETFSIDLSPLKLDNPFTYPLQKQEISVQLIQDGHLLAGPTQVPLSVPLSDISYNLLVLDSHPAALHFLANHLFDIVHRGQDTGSLGGTFLGSGNINAMINPIVLLTTSPALLPSSPQAYAPVDAVALGDLDLENHASQAQVDALRGFVCSGGTLIVSGGPDINRLKSCPLHDLFPLIPNGIRTLTQLPTLVTRYQTPLLLHHPIALITGTLQHDAKVLLTDQQGNPLVLERPYGNGVVLFTTFDYMDPAFTTWPAAASFWRDLLLSGNFEVSPVEILANDGMWTGSTNLMDGLLDALANPQATQLPSLGLIALFTLGYVLLLVPVNYLVLKRMDRKELAWLTTPAIILLFSIGSYAIGASMRAHIVSFNRVAVLETQAGSDRAYGLAQMALYLPAPANVSITLSSTDATPNNRLYYPQFMAVSDPSLLPNSGTLVVDDAGVQLRNVQVPFWSTCNFEAPFELALGGSVETTARWYTPHTIQLSIHNGTRFALKNAEVSVLRRSYGIGDIAPNSTAHITLPLSSLLYYSANYGFTNTVTVSPPPLTATDSQKRLLTQALADLLSGTNVANTIMGSFGFGGAPNMLADDGFGRASLLLTAWLDVPVVPAQIDGHDVAGDETALLCVHLPTPPNAPINFPGISPFSEQPLTDIPSNRPAATNTMPLPGGR